MLGKQPDGEQAHRAYRGESSNGEDSPGLSYDGWERQELLQRAHELDVGGRAAMTKPELIDALHDNEPHGNSQRLPELAEELTRTAAASAEPPKKERFVYAYRASGMLRPADIWLVAAVTQWLLPSVTAAA